ncbi:MAG: tetratricopeptide repeat protein, partial [Caldimonas sp.]
MSPTASRAHDDRSFEARLAELDVLNDLRDSDPTEALKRLTRWRSGRDALAPWQHSVLQQRGAALAAVACMILGRYDDARRELDLETAQLDGNALAAAPEALRERARRARVANANHRGYIAQHTGDYPAALRHYLDSLEGARAIGNRQYEALALMNTANTYEESGLFVAALEHHTEALALALAQDLQETVGEIHHNMGNAYAASGDPELALASGARAIAVFESLGLPGKVELARMGLADHLVQLGRHAEAAQALQGRTASAKTPNGLRANAYAAQLLGQIAAARGEPLAAQRAFEESLELAAQLEDKVGQARALMHLARLDAGANRPAQAYERAADALARLDGSDAHREQQQAHQLLCEIAKQRGDTAAALRHHEQFHAIYARGFNAVSSRQAHLLAVRHEVAMARAETERARVENARLAEALAEIGARLEQINANGAPAPHVAAGPAKPEDLRALGLTPREAEVLYWVAQGKTNQEVALILATGMPAVKKHLGSIYRKLGVENRMG